MSLKQRPPPSIKHWDYSPPRISGTSANRLFQPLDRERGGGGGKQKKTTKKKNRKEEEIVLWAEHSLASYLLKKKKKHEKRVKNRAVIPPYAQPRGTEGARCVCVLWPRLPPLPDGAEPRTPKFDPSLRLSHQLCFILFPPRRCVRLIYAAVVSLTPGKTRCIRKAYS